MAELMKGFLRDKDLEHYEKCHLAYKRAYKDIEPLFIFGEDRFQSHIVKKLPAKQKLTILGIGTGTGEPDCYMMKQLLPTFPSLHAVNVDPSAEYNEQFKEYFEKNSQDLSGVVPEWHNASVEDYFKRCDIENIKIKFDFISSLYSLFYVKNAAAFLSDLYNRLEKGGIIMIVIPSDDHVILTFRAHFIGNVDASYPPGVFMRTGQVTDFLKQAGMPFETVRLKNPVDITNCFDENSCDGSYVLDFLTQVPNTKKIAPELSVKCLDVLKSMSYKGPDGRLFCDGDSDVIIIQGKI